MPKAFQLVSILVC